MATIANRGLFETGLMVRQSIRPRLSQPHARRFQCDFEGVDQAIRYGMPSFKISDRGRAEIGHIGQLLLCEL
jgi:hypothetical protein